MSLLTTTSKGVALQGKAYSKNYYVCGYGFVGVFVCSYQELWFDNLIIMTAIVNSGVQCPTPPPPPPPTHTHTHTLTHTHTHTYTYIHTKHLPIGEIIAEKRRIPTPDKYALFKVINGKSTLIRDHEKPQEVKLQWTLDRSSANVVSTSSAYQPSSRFMAYKLRTTPST